MYHEPTRVETVEFTKGHGTGNDFVILPDPDGSLELTPSLVAALCDRHRGIGADGVLRVVRSAKHPDAVGYAAEAEWFMDYWNADGSSPRCAATASASSPATWWRTAWPRRRPSGLPVATRAGVVRAVVDSPTIAVHMTTPRVYAASTANIGALTLPGVAVDCGNPHLVCGLPSSLDDLDLHRAPRFDESLFPAGVNVEFVSQADPLDGADLHVRMRVYERGSGETLSCGSGALAVGAVALRDAGRTSGVVAVDLPGGRLTVTATRHRRVVAGRAGGAGGHRRGRRGGAELMPLQRVAHRGYSAIAPENTLPALAAAVLSGATYVEFDVRTTADGVPVVIHDRTVDRTTDGSGHVVGSDVRRAARAGRGIVVLPGVRGGAGAVARPRCWSSSRTWTPRCCWRSSRRPTSSRSRSSWPWSPSVACWTAPWCRASTRR